MGKENNVKFTYIEPLQLESQCNKSFTGHPLVDLEDHFPSSITKAKHLRPSYGLLLIGSARESRSPDQKCSILEDVAQKVFFR